MKRWLRIASLAFKEKLAFRADHLFSLLGALVLMGVLRSLWVTLYQQGLHIPEISLEQMLSYVIITAFIAIVFSIDIEFQMEERIKTGDVCLDLIRPLDFQLWYCLRALGEAAFHLTAKGIPLGLFLIIVFRVPLPPWPVFLSFAASFALGLLLFIWLGIIIGTICFWTKIIWSYCMIKRLLIVFLSGMIVPLWFFPAFLKPLLEWLPFKYLYFVPASIFVQATPTAQIPWILIKQCAWLIIFIFIARRLLAQALKRLSVHGG